VGWGGGNKLREVNRQAGVEAGGLGGGRALGQDEESK